MMPSASVQACCELSIIVPAYQESEHLATSIQTIIIHTACVTDDYELIVVDDGSTDNTWAVICRMHDSNPRVRGLRLSRNFGKEYAITAGLNNCCGRAIVLLDADLQHPPALIPKFFQLWKLGQADIIEGVKKRRFDEPLLRRTSSQLFNVIATWATGIDFKNSSDFKLLDRRAVAAWANMPERRCFFRGMAKWIGFRRIQVEFEVDARRSGRSKWNLRSLVRLAWSAITAYSAVPLRIIHLWAVGFLVFAVALSIRALYLRFTGQAFSGFTTVIILILLLGGLLMLSLGVIAEYIAAIYEEVKSRPRYVISERLGL